MAFQKFRADHLFDGYQLLDNQHVLITQGNGVVEAVVPISEAGNDIQQWRGILSPGLVNCHCHLELSHMKGIIPGHSGLIDFVLSVMQQRQAPEELIMQALEAAETSMIDNGIVAVGDICNTVFTLPQKAKRRMRYRNFIEASGVDPAMAAMRFRQSEDVFTSYDASEQTETGANSIVPHAPYSVAPGLWEKIVSFPGNGLLTMHNQEAEAENELFLYGTGDFLRLYERLGIDPSFFQPTGRSSLQSVLPNFKRDQSVLLVHNVHTSEEDWQFCATHAPDLPDLYWCLCPNANKYISNSLPDVAGLMRHSSQIVLGTDSLASNHQLSILSEMHTLRQHFPFLSLQNLLRWATSNGARALNFHQQLGSFEKGKRPHVILIDDALTRVQTILGGL